MSYLSSEIERSLGRGLRSDGRRAQILVNPQDNETACTVGGVEYKLSPLSAILINI